MGYPIGKSRLNIGLYAFERPGMISGTQGFKQKNTASQAKYDYLLGGTKDWFVGGQLNCTLKR